MTRITVLIHPEEDEAAEIVGAWLVNFKSRYEAKFPDRSLESLRGVTETRRGRVEEKIVSSDSEDNSVDIVAFYGHGTRCSICVKSTAGRSEAGAKIRPYTADCDKCGECDKLPVKEPLIDSRNKGLCMGREIYVVACSTARKLGRTVIRDATANTAYFGYIGKIVVPPDYFPGLADRVKHIVNDGLKILHDRDGYGSHADRYNAVADAVRKGFWRLNREIRLRSGCITFEQLLIRMWGLFFHSDWVKDKNR